MSWSAYLSFVAFATVLVLVPGADFTVIVKNTLAGGTARGRWSATGVATSNAVQGVAAVAGLGAVVVRIQPLFQAIKWAGIAYLAYLAVQALRSAWRGRYTPFGDGPDAGRRGWREGFLSNITNPKVLVFYLAVLPQFIGPATPWTALLALAVTHALLSLSYLMLVVAGLHRVRRVLHRRPVRRALDALTGAVLLGFGTRLALDRA